MQKTKIAIALAVVAFLSLAHVGLTAAQIVLAKYTRVQMYMKAFGAG